MSDSGLLNAIRRQRLVVGLSQAALAARAGISRQTLIAIEAGRQVPATSIALRLARSLGCAVDDLFQLSPPEGLPVMLPALGGSGGVATAAAADPGLGARLTVGAVDGRWVAHRLGGDSPLAADGILDPHAGGAASEEAAAGSAPTTAIARPLLSLASLRQNILVAGCAPLLGPFAQRAGIRFHDTRISWVPANSEQALGLLTAGLVHVAGVHLSDDQTEHGNLVEVERRFPTSRMLVVNLTRWRQGLVVAAGNPLAIRNVTDLLRPGLRLARREPGAGAAKLLQRLLERGGREQAETLSGRGGPIAASHAEVAQLVRYDVADAGVAIESVALAAGLSFVPLAEERFDLVVSVAHAAERPVARLIELLEDRSFRADAASLPGYDCAMCGQVTTVGAA